MDKRTIILIVTLFGLIILGMFIFAILNKTENQPAPQPVVKNEPISVDKYAYLTNITAKHFYQNGKHTFAGEIEMPTPCDLVDVSSESTATTSSQIKLNFSVINNSQDCEQKIINQRFLVEASAMENATVTASFMGRAIELNLVPALPGETPENFELFIKG